MRLTIQCGIVKLTKKKQKILDLEYSNLQRFLKGEKDVPLYSANKQQALRYFKKIKQKEYPISLRNDLINIQKTKSFYFLKIPVYKVRGGIKVPIKPHREIPENAKICESKIIRKKGKYIAMLTFEIPTQPIRKCSSIIGIDFGERVPATAVLLQNGQAMKPNFYGREIRGIRRHYNWLRKRLQERGLTKVVKRIGKREKRLINDILHKISTCIVRQAIFTNSYITFGNLFGIRKRVKGKGKRLNRIVSNMPYFKLANMIEYKAMLNGVPVIVVNEAHTSTTCHICNNEGKRNTQGQFNCSFCGSFNADWNGAINIAKKAERFLSYMDLNGGFCGQSLNESVEFHNSPLEAPSFKAG